MKSVVHKKGSGAGAAKGALAKRKTVGEINRWMSANYADVMRSARRNCVRLTGKLTLGGTSSSGGASAGVRRGKSG